MNTTTQQLNLSCLTKHKIILKFSDTFQLPAGDKRVVSAWFQQIGFDAPLSNEQQQKLVAPAMIHNFPEDLHNSALQHSGVYTDGWAQKNSCFYLASSVRQSNFILKGSIPSAEGLLFSPFLKIYIDGKLILERELSSGVFEFQVPIFLSEQEKDASSKQLKDLKDKIKHLHEQCFSLKTEELVHELQRLNATCDQVQTLRIYEDKEFKENQQQIIEKYQLIIQEQEKALNVYRHQDWQERFNKAIQPKLGELCHHKPKKLHIPQHYYQKPSSQEWPLISIATPAFRHGNFIEATIKSVLEQDYPNLEYVVKDGGSTDNTVEILKSYGDKLTHWESTKDTGQSQAINVGFSHTTGEIMAYLNSDDLLLPGALHYVAHYFQQNPDVDAVYGHRVLIDENGFEIGRWIIPPHQDEILSWVDYIPQETLFWRRSLWEKINGSIDESFQFAMDWDLLLRFREASAKIVRLPRFLGAFRVHPHQKSSAAISDVGAREMQRLRERAQGGRMVDSTEIKKNTRTYFRTHQWLHMLYKANLVKY